MDKYSLLGVKINEPVYILDETQYNHLKNKIKTLITEKNALKKEVEDLKAENVMEGL